MDLKIEAESLGYILSKNFYLLFEGLDVIEERVAYLRAKKFTDDGIGAIITKTPLFLSLRSVYILCQPSMSQFSLL